MIRIAFFITCLRGVNSGLGGHYRSLLETAKAGDWTFDIFVIGNMMPQPFQTLANVHLIDPKRFDYEMRQPSNADRLHRAHVLHCYDEPAAMAVMFLSARLRRPMVVTKPGGPLAGRGFVPWKNMVVFQNSDLDDLSSRIFRPQCLELIPQRVMALSTSPVARQNPFADAPADALRIITIARFHSLHYDRFRQAINLGRALRKSGRRAVVALVGYVHDDTVYRAVLEMITPDDEVRIFSDANHTRDAAELIGFADIVVASGRGFPEALRASKLVFATVADSDLPCLISAENYEDAAAHNFSSRAPKTPRLDPENSLVRFLSMSAKERANLAAWSVRCFDENHSASTGAIRLTSFYRTLSGFENIWSCRARRLWQGIRRLGRGLGSGKRAQPRTIGE